MTNIDIISQWAENVQRYDATDPVLGGDAGESNIPVKQLAYRTQYLYDHLWFRDIAIVNSATTIDQSFSFKLIRIETGSNLNINLADVSHFVTGSVLGFTCKTVSAKTQTIFPFGSQVFEDGNVSFSKVWLCDGEKLILVADTDRWQVLIIPANHYLAGEDDLVRRIRRNSVIGQGQIGNRADYARLFENIQADAIPDIIWNSDPIRYKARFSLGNGSTTFRFPDLRGLTNRALDLGRGLSFGRFDNVPGGYEADAVGPVSASITGKVIRKSGTSNSVIVLGIPDGSVGGAPPDPTFGDRTIPVSINTGASETRVKNVGKIPIIYY